MHVLLLSNDKQQKSKCSIYKALGDRNNSIYFTDTSI